MNASLKVNEYLTPNGRYQVTIAPNTTSYWDWNYKRMVTEYPKLIAKLKSLGFTNKSRDLHMKEYGIPATFETQSEANKIAKLYRVILNGLK